jgi:hypothetical protein
MARNTSCIAGASPMISGTASGAAGTDSSPAGCSPAPCGEGAFRDRDHLVDIEGLGQVLEGALLVGGDGAVEVRVRGGDDHRHVRVLLADATQQFDAVDAGHANVADHHVRLLPREAPQHAFRVLEAFLLDARL